jgi:hypothetical protein
LEFGSFSYWFDKPWFHTEGRLVVVLIIPSSWGFQLGGHLHAIRRLLGFAMESFLSAHSFARLMRWSIVLGLHRPNSSLKSRRMRPSRKASIALSGKMFSDVLHKLSHRDMYDLRLSPIFCTHRRSFSNDMGRCEVPRKFAIKACRNSSQERMLSGARLLSHALVLSFRCNDNN